MADDVVINKKPFPLYEPERPTWQTRFWFGYPGKPYDKQKEWWAEMGYEDHAIKQGRMRLARYSLKELDPYYYDPPVAKGESKRGQGGLDTKYYPNLVQGAEYPPTRSGELLDRNKWREYLRDSDPVVQYIKSKYDISPEHPGLKFRPSPNSRHTSHLGRADGSGYAYGLGLSRLGPAFFDTPMGYDCHMKALAAAKYMFFTMLPIGAAYHETYNTPSNIALPGAPRVQKIARNVKLFAKFIHWPIVHAFFWGGAVCLCAQVRQKDDWLNPIGASTITGVLSYSKTASVGTSFQIALMAAFVGVIWNISRAGLGGIGNAQLHAPSTYYAPTNEFMNSKYYAPSRPAY